MSILNINQPEPREAYGVFCIRLFGCSLADEWETQVCNEQVWKPGSPHGYMSVVVGSTGDGPGGFGIVPGVSPSPVHSLWPLILTSNQKGQGEAHHPSGFSDVLRPREIDDCLSSSLTAVHQGERCVCLWTQGSSSLPVFWTHFIPPIPGSPAAC